MATILSHLGADHVLTVHSHDGLDEVSVSDKSTIFEYRRDEPGGRVLRREFAPEQLGLRRYPLEALRGSTAEENARIVNDVLSATEGAPREIVLANAAHAIYVSGSVSEISEALEAARESIDSGRAQRALEQLRDASNSAPTD
jgi:anthranilate phosphoribosyltransferase